MRCHVAQHNAQSIELESKKSREGAREPIGKDLLGSLFSMEGFRCASLVLGTDTEVEWRHTKSRAKGQIRDGMGRQRQVLARGTRGPAVEPERVAILRRARIDRRKRSSLLSRSNFESSLLWSCLQSNRPPQRRPMYGFIPIWLDSNSIRDLALRHDRPRETTKRSAVVMHIIASAFLCMETTSSPHAFLGCDGKCGIPLRVFPVHVRECQAVHITRRQA